MVEKLSIQAHSKHPHHPLSTDPHSQSDKENKNLNSLQQSLGCPHYKRGCAKQCDECKEFFPCRFCHNEAKSDLEKDAKKQHEINRFAVKLVKCLNCANVQKPSAKCEGCGLKFGNYFCSICNLWDYDTSKEQFHC